MAEILGVDKIKKFCEENFLRVIDGGYMEVLDNGLKVVVEGSGKEYSTEGVDDLFKGKSLGGWKIEKIKDVSVWTEKIITGEKVLVWKLFLLEFIKSN